MLEFGKRYTWEFLKKTYPDKYVILSDVIVGDNQIESGVLHGVCDYSERDELMDSLINHKGISCLAYRTTPVGGYWSGILTCDLEALKSC